MTAAEMRSPLHASHRALGASLSTVGSWRVCAHYRTGLAVEAAALRDGAGVGDVTHLGLVTVEGVGALDYLNEAVATELATLSPGQSTPALALDPTDGDIVFVGVVYVDSAERVVLAPSSGDVTVFAALLGEHAPPGIAVRDLSASTVRLHLRGPRSAEVLRGAGLGLSVDELDVGDFEIVEAADEYVLIARGHDDADQVYDVVASRRNAVTLWTALTGEDAGTPVGHEALEAVRILHGVPAIGHEIGAGVHPETVGLGSRVATTKHRFWGAEVVRQTLNSKLSLRILEGVAQARASVPAPSLGAQVFLSQHVPVGQLSSVGFSSARQRPVALALLSTVVHPDADVVVDVGGIRQIFSQRTPLRRPLHTLADEQSPRTTNEEKN